MKRCVIISAASINNYEKLKTFLKPDDFYIFCDGGLNHCKKLNIIPDLIVGDFDSFKISQMPDDIPVDIIKLPCEKDDTDTFFAVKEGLKRGYKDFLLLGVIGNRFDHSLCNISALIYLHNHGATAKIIDDFSEMEIISSGETGKIPDIYSYFSLMNVAGDVSGVTITGAKYPLKDAEIKAEYSFGISNEVLPGQTATVVLNKGTLLLVKVW